MIDNPDGLMKFFGGCATILGAVLGSVAMLRPPKDKAGGEKPERPTLPSNPGPSPDVFEEKFRQGERRMEAIEMHQQEQDRRFEEMRKDQMAVKLELAELRPTFQALKDVVGSLRDGVQSVEETLAGILSRLPHP